MTSLFSLLFLNYPMHKKICIFFIVLFIKSNSMNDDNFITTEKSLLSMLTNEQTCIYCYTAACHCPSTQFILNCSSYVLNISSIENCTETITWKTVDFSLRNLTTLDSNILLSLRMERLLLKSNFITYIHNNTFDSIGDILIELDLEKNLLSNVSSKWLNSKLHCLEKLNLALNQLQSFDNVQYTPLPNLKELNLSYNRIDTFPNGLYKWTSLNILDLSFNKLSSIPRFAFNGLDNLTWLSLASNKNLTCVIRNSFKHLKSLQYLDLSRTNLLYLDPCIFHPLASLRTLSVQRMLFNCTSCWLPIAREQSLKIFGQCIDKKKVQNIDSLTDKQIENACSKSSITCTTDYCEPGSMKYDQQKINSSLSLTENPRIVKRLTLELILCTLVSVISLTIIITLIIALIRRKQNKALLCCHISRTTTNMTMAEETRRRRQQIIDKNPTVIESVVTHGANMNVPSHPYQNYAKCNDETSNNKRKLYNPMFADSPASDSQHQQQSKMVSNDSISYNSEVYSENL